MIDVFCFSCVSLLIYEVLVFLLMFSVCFEVFDDYFIFVFIVFVLDLVFIVLLLGNLLLLWVIILFELNIVGL